MEFWGIIFYMKAFHIKHTYLDLYPRVDTFNKHLITKYRIFLPKSTNPRLICSRLYAPSIQRSMWIVVNANWLINRYAMRNISRSPRLKNTLYLQLMLFRVEMTSTSTADIGKGFIPQKFSGFVSLFKPEKFNKFEQRFWQWKFRFGIFGPVLFSERSIIPLNIIFDAGF